MVQPTSVSGPIAGGGRCGKVLSEWNGHNRGDVDLDVGAEIIISPSHKIIVYIGKVNVTAGI